MQNESYLEDGVYIKFDGFGFELYTDRMSDGGGPERVMIYLEPTGLKKFIEFAVSKGFKP